MSAAVRVAFWMLVSSIGFAAILVIVRELSETMPVIVLNFWRNIFAVLLFIPWILRAGTSGLRTSRLPLFTLRALFMVTSSIMLFYAAILIPIAEATAISFTSPLFATLLAALLLKEQVGWRRAAALGVGFAGVLIIMRPGAEAISSGALIAIASSLLFAFVVIMGKRLAATESPELVILMLSLLSLPISFVPALTVWDVPEGNEWFWVVGLGVAANINMYGIQRALGAGDTSLTQVVDFIRLPVAALAAWIAFREVPDPWMWAGAAVIFIAAVYTTRRESRMAGKS